MKLRCWCGYYSESARNYDASRNFPRQISPLFFDGVVTLFLSMRYLPSADGPLNVFFKLPVTEISQVDDHKSVSLPSFKISFKISQVDIATSQ